ncbi:MAG: hypothetical protein ATN36_03620 [Epulopiscium sp. Nele67-Bin005]|nr:MAG: hypothetical protein ATN36_03620 [Epulopiscium sp. Nele67-Bin005]
MKKQFLIVPIAILIGMAWSVREISYPEMLSFSTSKSEAEISISLGIFCDTILNNISMLDENKHTLIPDDGIILPTTKFIAYENESVFDVLLRETRANKIHMEFVDTPIYNSAYIEGINNIYEFDVGELSGWLYSVNGEFPTVGCSQYTIQAGDIIEWHYTCNLGEDVRYNNE